MNQFGFNLDQGNAVIPSEQNEHTKNVSERKTF